MPMVAPRDLDILQEADGIADHGYGDVLSGKVIEQSFEIRADQPGMFTDAIAQGLGCALDDAVFSIEKEPDEHGKTRLILTDIANDPVGLLFAVFFLEKLLNIDGHLAKFNA